MTTITVDTKQYVKALQQVHGGLSIVAANTVNTAAHYIETKYKQELKRSFTLRNKFTLGAVKLNKAKAVRSSGEFRPVENINAIVGVMNLKGKDHYLLKQEIGDTKKGTSATAGFVAKPLDSARSGQSHNRPIANALRLQTTAVQTLKFNNGKPLGTPNDGFKDKQRWAILYQYTGRSGGGYGNVKRKRTKEVGRYNWNIKKPFYFQGLLQGFGVFQHKSGDRISMIRKLDDKSITIKARHGFMNAFHDLTDSMFGVIFKREAMRHLNGVK